MPRHAVERLGTVTHLSILDETGAVDKALEPDIPETDLLEMHRAMLYGRCFDERMLKLQRQGRIGTFAPIKGQEAAQIGAAAHLRPSDWLVPSFREIAAQIWRGAKPRDIWLFAAGYNEGVAIPEDARDLPLCVPVATQLLHAAGVAYATKYRGEDDIVMTFHGDGATSEGDFHEALNFSGVLDLPVVFVCQNNQWAISLPLAKQTRSKTIAQKAVAYGIPGLRVDGNDILAVWVAAKEAVDRARNEQIPTLLECVTYRMEVHTTADDPTRYRTEDDVAPWRKRDPISRFETYLKAKGLIDDKTLKGMRETFRDALKHDWQETQERIEELDAGDPMGIFDALYAQDYPHITEQKAYFRERLKRERAHG
ncbi:pyruvate dehydrogenase (acetyl-transferring) E1 component subunit alpha [Iodidimonas muriae]|uniref:Pyruvate dehydrogenase E1 component subunit alpha n=1 Tax=Iodidimonas muriae TaxID=261467 RepID=A0ABQ2L6V2_9PROT|nr:pyruvate dehydrogenase (acetyl-transferring) E1 component subunit alpha [Iodidimonas muriae]GER06574.1 pyruvate dehydrogenase (acetyl-transferring) E1 component subunit alpha [Kordiimonadales bacterium JCM 17843]GGO05337.1 pyruvate dehydrogenase (acetyl-transferring) E1 component subunit alpha [Iodidimonas muriae]